MIGVLHVMSNLSLKSGIASVVVNYCKYIDRNKIKSAIIYFDEINTETYIDELKTLNVDVFKFHRKKFISEWNNFCKEHYGEYDILHNHHSFLGFLFIGAKKKLGIKVLLNHAHVTKYGESVFKGLRNAFLSVSCRFISDKFVACSKDAGFAMFGPRFRHLGFVMKNAIDLNKFKFDLKSRQNIRNKLGIGNEWVVGHIGNMTPQKNHFFILKIFEYVHKVDNTAKLLLVGDGYLHDEIRKEIKEKKLENNVIDLGVRNDVNVILNAMDVFFLPSLFEGLGIVLVEAQANGLRCVYSDQVPMEADVNNKMNSRLSLNAPIQEWVDSLMFKTERIDNSILLKKNHYEIETAAKDLEMFYTELIRDKKI